MLSLYDNIPDNDIYIFMFIHQVSVYSAFHNTHGFIAALQKVVLLVFYYRASLSSGDMMMYDDL